jgi:two-component system, OmpR family, response regulator
MAVDWQKLQVLVVDDQRFILSLIFHILKELGIRPENVYQATNSEDALKVLKSLSVDVVICDVNMAPVSGLHLVRQIRSGQAAVTRDVPVIFLTAHSDAQTVKVAAQLDANAFIVKPVAKKDLGAKIERVLEARRPLRDGKAYEAVTVELSDSVKAAAAMDGTQSAAAAMPKADAAAQPQAPARDVQRISVGALKEGDSLVADVTAPDGTVLAKAGAVLSHDSINRLVNAMSAFNLGQVDIAPRKSA